MASVRQRGKAKSYYALFRDGKGKLVERRCKGAKTRREAQTMADDMEKMARPTAAQSSVENMRRVIADLHRKYLGTEAPKMSVRDYVKHWLDGKTNEVGQETMEKYSNATRRLLEHLGTRADDDLFSVSKNDIVQWRDGEAKRVGSVATNQSLKILRMVFLAARNDEWTPENPTLGVKPVKVKPGEKVQKRPFTLEEIRAILDACPTDEWRAMVVRGYFTGQRLRDICLMRANQEDVELQRVKFRTSKTGRLVLVPMHPEYVEWALSQPTTDDPTAPLHPVAFASVMSKIERKAKSKTSTQSNQFTRILAAVGLREKDTHRKRDDSNGRSARRRRAAVDFHALRHSLSSHLADHGTPQNVIKGIVGHETDEASEGYTHIEFGVMQAAVKRLPRLGLGETEARSATPG